MPDALPPGFWSRTVASITLCALAGAVAGLVGGLLSDAIGTGIAIGISVGAVVAVALVILRRERTPSP